MSSVWSEAQHFANLNLRMVYMIRRDGRLGFTIFPPSDPAAKRLGLEYVKGGEVLPSKEAVDAASKRRAS